MLKKVIETLIGGAIGVAALYVVAKVAYHAGHDMAEVEHQYDALATRSNGADANNNGYLAGEHADDIVMESDVVAPKKKQSKLGLFMNLRKLFRKKGGSILSELVNSPEDHQLEAYIHGGEVHIDIKKRRPASTYQEPMICTA